MDRNLPATVVKRVSNIEQILIENEGEITTELEKTIFGLSKDVDFLHFTMKRLDSVGDYYAQQAEWFSKLSKSCKGTSEFIKDCIQGEMEATKLDQLEGQSVVFKRVKSNPRCVVDDESKIPKEYFRTKTTTEIDKTKLKEDLKIGPIEGARLEPVFSLRSFALTPKLEGGINE